jgi:hypothetical protein
VIPASDFEVALGCFGLVTFTFGVLVGTWLCDRKVTKILKEGTVKNIGSHEYRRNLADLKPGDRL